MRLSKLQKYINNKVINDQVQMLNDNIVNNSSIYNLAERTAVFGENVIDFVRKLPKNIINLVLVRQLIRSATSIGANYVEADCAATKKDFKYKISLCKKEAKETVYWLRMMTKTNIDNLQECDKLQQEAQELLLIFSKILITCEKKDREAKKKLD